MAAEWAGLEQTVKSNATFSHFGLAPPYLSPTNPSSAWAANLSRPQQRWRAGVRALSPRSRPIPTSATLALPHPTTQHSACVTNHKPPPLKMALRWVGFEQTAMYNAPSHFSLAPPHLLPTNHSSASAAHLRSPIKHGAQTIASNATHSHISLAPPHLPPTKQGSACAANPRAPERAEKESVLQAGQPSTPPTATAANKSRPRGQLGTPALQAGRQRAPGGILAAPSPGPGSPRLCRGNRHGTGVHPAGLAATEPLLSALTPQTAAVAADSEEAAETPQQPLRPRPARWPHSPLPAPTPAPKARHGLRGRRGAHSRPGQRAAMCRARQPAWPRRSPACRGGLAAKRPLWPSTIATARSGGQEARGAAEGALTSPEGSAAAGANSRLAHPHGARRPAAPAAQGGHLPRLASQTAPPAAPRRLHRGAAQRLLVRAPLQRRGFRANQSAASPPFPGPLSRPLTTTP
uniref:translation initiation factor IF-2-like n=1 Tax=Callithrix jacchus TaxID=9483 RepID=UPI0023DD4B7A|nr:translation initiation factor IF-2-like [Callithrix jacchus]